MDEEFRLNQKTVDDINKVEAKVPDPNQIGSNDGLKQDSLIDGSLN